MQWIKIDTHLTTDMRVRGFTAEEAATWLAMMCMAGRENGNKRGRLRNNKRTAKFSEIALEAGVAEAVVTSTVTKALEHEWLLRVVDEESDEVNYEIADWDLTQVDRTAAERQARHREALAQQAHEDIVTCDNEGHALEETTEDETTSGEIVLDL